MKKFTKRSIAALLAGIMAISLSACSTASNDGSNKDASNTSKQETKSGSAQASQTTGDKKVIKFFHRFPD